MKYKKKPTLTEATQWFRNGDHPKDESTPIDGQWRSGNLTEGKVVKFFRSLTVPGGRFCPQCGNEMQKHGILEGINGQETVCPSDYIVTDSRGRYYKLSATEFETLYEPYEERPQTTTPRTEDGNST